jgi:hypothetical protein
VPPAAEQELVRIGGEMVCAIPAVARELNSQSAIDSLYDPANHGRELVVGESKGQLQVAGYRLPAGKLWSSLRGKSWRSRELKIARLLFHLERFGIAAPKLLAYGQRPSSRFAIGAFVLAQPMDCEPPTFGDAERLRALLERLHGTGCQLRGIGTNGEPFGKHHDDVVIHDLGRLRLNRRLSERHMARDRARLEAWLEGVR